MTASTPRIRCPNACTEPCSYPACKCHEPADMGTTLGIEAVKARDAAASMNHYRISASTVVCVLLASPFIGAIGWAVAARLFN